MMKAALNHSSRRARFATEIAGLEIGADVRKTLQSELSENVVDLRAVGALTSKPYAFLTRPWEVESRESVDLSDSMGSSLLIQSRSAEILRVLPRYHSERNEDWLTDRARFSYDGLKYQRLDRPYIREEGKLRLATWDEALEKARAALSSVDASQIKAVIGESVDSFSALYLKEAFEKMGSPNVFREGNTKGLSVDSPKNYSLWPSLVGMEKADLVLLVGIDTRHEASLLNLRLRKSVVENRLQVASIGSPVDLTFDTQHLGSSMVTLGQLAEGKHPFAQEIARAKNPLIVLGGGFSEWGGKGLDNLLESFPAASAVVPQGGNNVGLMEMGLQEDSGSKGAKVTYLLAADESRPSEDSFVIYQGHHGDVNASKADIILPGAAFTEKGGLYMNAEGRPAKVDRVLASPGESREDTTILQDLFQGMDKNLQPLYEKKEDFQWWFDSMGWSPEDKGILSGDPSLLSTYTSPEHGSLRGVLPGTFQEQSSPKTKVAGLPLDRRPLRSSVLDFYKTNSITRASPLMTKCSSVYRDNSNFKN